MPMRHCEYGPFYGSCSGRCYLRKSTFGQVQAAASAAVDNVVLERSIHLGKIMLQRDVTRTSETWNPIIQHETYTSIKTSLTW